MSDCKHCKSEQSVGDNLICQKCGKRQVSIFITNPILAIVVIVGLLLAAESFYKWLKWEWYLFFR